MLTHEVDQQLELNGIAAVPDLLIDSFVRDRLCEINGGVQTIFNELISDGIPEFDVRGILEKHLLHLIRRLQAGIPISRLGAVYDGFGNYDYDTKRASHIM